MIGALVMATIFAIPSPRPFVNTVADLPTATAPATRMGLPPALPVPTGINGLPFAPEGLDNCAEMNFYRVQAGLPYRFSDQPRTGAKGYGWRESNCRNEDGVHTSCCHGYWQLHEDHFWPGNIFDTECGVNSYLDVNSDTPIDKQRQACAAKVLFDRDGYSPWQT